MVKIERIKTLSPQGVDPGKADLSAVFGDRYLAKEPDYKGMIPPGLLRRMGKAVRMGVGAGFPLIEAYPEVEAIIVGTANGGLENCIHFLNQIVDYKEGALTPTAFVQSTPAAVAGQLAMMGKNRSYNVTHVNKWMAFESALADALLFIDENPKAKVLLLAVDEISNYNWNIDWLQGLYKEGEQKSTELIGSPTPGTICGEGATGFVLSKSEESKGILDVAQMVAVNTEEILNRLAIFLAENNCTTEDIKNLITGKNGDVRYDPFYDEVMNNFPLAQSNTYKQWTGEYPTVNAFAVAYTKVLGLKGKTLIYNQCLGEHHSWILMDL